MRTENSIRNQARKIFVSDKKNRKYNEMLVKNIKNSLNDLSMR